MTDVTSTSVYPFPDYPEPKPCPYTETNVESITALAPKPVDFFPDCVKYPPPVGTKDIVNGCGCLMTEWRDTQFGTSLRLETIWNPLYDTQDIIDTDGPCSFFQSSDGRSYAFTNMQTAGQLTWPKRFHIWEIEFTFEDPTVPDQWMRVPGNSPVVTIRIGEKDHFRVPFAMFHKVPTRTNTYCAPLPSPLYLPPVQNFCIILGQSKGGSVRVARIRCALNGYLHREIP